MLKVLDWSTKFGRIFHQSAAVWETTLRLPARTQCLLVRQMAAEATPTLRQVGMERARRDDGAMRSRRRIVRS
jgi:hypothetical protein